MLLYNEAVNNLLNTKDTFSLNMTCCLINSAGVHIEKTELINWLREQGYLNKQSGDRYTPSKMARNRVRPFMVCKLASKECEDGVEREVARVTPYGLLHFIERLTSGFIDENNCYIGSVKDDLKEHSINVQLGNEVEE